MVVMSFVVMGAAYAEKSYYYNYTNKDYGFSIGLPNNWERKNVNEVIPIMAICPPEGQNDDFQESISVAIDKNIGGMDLKTYLNESIKSMKTGLKGFKNVKTGSIKLGNSDSMWLIYTHKADTGLEIKAVAYFLVKNHRGYVITCSTTTKEFMNNMTLFEEISKTFKFTK